MVIHVTNESRIHERAVQSYPFSIDEHLNFFLSSCFHRPCAHTDIRLFHLFSFFLFFSYAFRINCYHMHSYFYRFDAAKAIEKSMNFLFGVRNSIR